MAKITKTHDGPSEKWRMTRLNRIEKLILKSNLKIDAIHDHEGCLSCYWFEMPNIELLTKIRDIWLTEGETYVENFYADTILMSSNNLPDADAVEADNLEFQGYKEHMIGQEAVKKYYDYQEQYKHPLWQKKRLEILQENNYTCSNCGAKDKTLHVHHNIYYKGRKIWDYENHYLLCLCEDCHTIAHKTKERLAEAIARLQVIPQIKLAELLELIYDSYPIVGIMEANHFDLFKSITKIIR